MAMTPRQRLLALAYGAVFVVLLPWLLAAWACNTAIVVSWQIPLPTWVGLPLTAAGFGLVLAGWLALWRHGGGLPMNAFPPPRLVRCGVYAWLAHPIYTGAVAATLGLGIAIGNATVCWLLAPMVAAGCAALVLGYEGPRFLARFPDRATGAFWSLPVADSPLRRHHRIAVLLRVLAVWWLCYEACLAIGPAADAVDGWLPFERDWPVWPATYPIYASAYLVVATAPFWAKQAGDLRDFADAGRCAIVLHSLCYLLVPVQVPPRAFEPTNGLGELLAFEARREAHGGAAFPSFHATWALLTAVLAARSWPRFRALGFLWAFAVIVSCSTTGMHAVLDLVAAGIVALLVHGRRRVWLLVRERTERLANSLRTWRLGPLRVFVHAPVAGAAAALVAATMLHCGATPLQVTIVCASAVAGAALWAQWIEGAAVSLRPFGYYGSVVGAAFALLALLAFGDDIATVAGSLALAAPFAQAIGRLRCLLQGCCHGRPASPGVGIVCRHPQSRVVRLAGLGGVPVHATQLYSLVWNTLLGIALTRCHQLGQPPFAIAGLYLLGNGLGRFVEEAYRGEPQTRRIGGLVEYQWLALASMFAGGLLSCAPSAWSTAEVSSAAAWLLPTATGLVVALAMGVDFPDSNRRFARLLK
jgi:protein-S-isoprenylcysteine O-methyltransferase Ste14